MISCLRQLSILKDDIKCTLCDIPMNDVKIKTGDFLEWRCNTCSHKKGIKTGAIFFGSKLNLSEILIILACFSQDNTSLEVQDNFYFSKEVVIKWFRLFRSFMTKEINRHFKS